MLGDNGRYSLTFNEAKKACKERRGGDIASREDMLQARSLGYEFCSWGWLSDGSKGLVLQNYTEDCLSSSTSLDGLYICHHCGLVDVFCKFL